MKLTAEVLNGVPALPGVYRFLDGDGAVLYVGKAMRLSRRLGQYKAAGRRRQHRRMKRIVARAATLVWEVTATHLDACLLEIRLIQELRPPLNVAGAYSFLYPYISFTQPPAGPFSLALTTRPELFPEAMHHGAFRSRDVCVEAVFALARLLSLIGHREPDRAAARAKRPRGTYVFAFRRLPAGWPELWRDFLRGRSAAALTELSLALLEHAGARARSGEIQADLAAVRRLYDDEILPLEAALTKAGGSGAYPVAQCDRDPLFIELRLG